MYRHRPTFRYGCISLMTRSSVLSLSLGGSVFAPQFIFKHAIMTIARVRCYTHLACALWNEPFLWRESFPYQCTYYCLISKCLKTWPWQHWKLFHGLLKWVIACLSSWNTTVIVTQVKKILMVKNLSPTIICRKKGVDSTSSVDQGSLVTRPIAIVRAKML